MRVYGFCASEECTRVENRDHNCFFFCGTIRSIKCSRHCISLYSKFIWNARLAIDSKSHQLSFANPNRWIIIVAPVWNTTSVNYAHIYSTKSFLILFYFIVAIVRLYIVQSNRHSEIYIRTMANWMRKFFVTYFGAFNDDQGPAVSLAWLQCYIGMRFNSSQAPK